MNNLIIFFLIFFLSFKSGFSRENGDTEITTEDGIEVFQEEKYYLLKKNVKILSDNLELHGQTVKIFFEKDLYDIKGIEANDEVNFISKEYNVKGKGNNVNINIKNQIITIYGIQSELYLENNIMTSDGKINVDNLGGSFFIDGPNSKLISENYDITGAKINGKFETIKGKREIAGLMVEDKKQLIIKTDDIVMFSKKAEFNKKKSIIELFEEVEIIRGNEIITGDYGILDTEKNSYKVKSNDSNKVKVIISNSDD